MTISAFDKEHVGDLVAGHGTWFTARLLRLCAAADHENLARLRIAFPDVVDAYLDWREGRLTP
jgi:hypothetical protein